MPMTVLMTFGERAAYAGRMLLIGMGAVFLSLALLWGVLEVFKRLVVREAKPTSPVTAPAPVPVAPAAPTTDDALIAAITAAVAATLAAENGGVAPAFRVVSFQKVPTVSKK